MQRGQYPTLGKGFSSLQGLKQRHGHIEQVLFDLFDAPSLGPRALNRYPSWAGEERVSAVPVIPPVPVPTFGARHAISRAAKRDAEVARELELFQIGQPVLKGHAYVGEQAELSADHKPPKRRSGQGQVPQDVCAWVLRVEGRNRHGADCSLLVPPSQWPRGVFARQAMHAHNLSFFSYLAAGFNALGWSLYLGAQLKQRIKASPVNQLMSLLIVAGVFMSEQALSSTRASLPYAVGVGAVVAAFLLSLRNPLKMARSDFGLLGLGVLFVAASVVRPREAALASSLYYLVNYWSYLSKLVRGVAVEWWAPWAVWVLGACCMLGGLVEESGWALLNPIANLMCWLCVGVVAWCKQQNRGVPSKKILSSG